MMADLSRRSILMLAAAVPVLALSRRALAQNAPLKIATIGSGNIGGFLGGQWVKAGHEVFFSSRNPDRLKPMIDKLGARARAGTPAEAIAFGDIVLLAVPYLSVPDIGKEYATALRGKIMMDTCNATPNRDGAELVELTKKNGIGLTTQSFFPGARLVRAFNTVGANILQREASRDGARLPIPIASDDAAAAAIAERLVRDAGFEPVNAGGLARADAFAQGNPGYGVHADAATLRKVLDGVK